MAANALELIERDLNRLAEKQQQEQQRRAGGIGALSAVPMQTSDGGNVNTSSTGERMELGSDNATRNEHDTLVAEFEARVRARMMQRQIPTDPIEVKLQLRALGEPICLFGEGPGERRDRLRDTLAARGENVPKSTLSAAPQAAVPEEEKPKTEVWYHEGSDELKTARMAIAAYSLPRARDRLRAARLKDSQPDPSYAASRQKLHNTLRTFTNQTSEFGDQRPISFCEFSPCGTKLATASWSGHCKVWSLADCSEQRMLKGHSERVGAVVWHPKAAEGNTLQLATCAADGKICYYDSEKNTPMAIIAGHEQRVSRIAFHPSGDYLASTCHDHSWRLWDVERRSELLHQEGHSRPVYGVAFHPDGSLVATSGLDAICRVWDLRSGRNVLTLQGHIKSVLAVDFSPNGYHMATGSDDHTVRLWDMRLRNSIYTIPAHNNLISSVRFQREHGEFLVTGSYDNTAKIWSTPECTPLKTLSGHDSKVMAADISPDGTCIATASYDRTFKLWGAE